MTAPRGNRPIIVLVGRRNVGKSALFNALTGQQKSIVADQPGTTTDPVGLPFELLPFGPVYLYDTAGLDDEGTLGQRRIEATKKILAQADLTVLVVDAVQGLGPWEKEFLARASTSTQVVLGTQSDQSSLSDHDQEFLKEHHVDFQQVNIYDAASCASALNFLAAHLSKSNRTLLQDLVKAQDKVLLVVPIDAAAPVGRLILPQVQVLREILDRHALATVVRPEELAFVINQKNNRPSFSLVIIDSQATAEVVKILPPTQKWTTFSILMGAAKGEFKLLLEGLKRLDHLAENATVLIAEACAHHQAGDDIARVKIPRLVEQYVGHKISFKFLNGGDFRNDLKGIDLVIHCGACMLSPTSFKARLKVCQEQGVAVTNFGLVLTKILAKQHPGLVFPS